MPEAIQSTIQIFKPSLLILFPMNLGYEQDYASDMNNARQGNFPDSMKFVANFKREIP